MVIPYAGMDPHEPPLVAPETKYLRHARSRQELAYRLFLVGYDTLDLATRFRCEEATALKWITAERCKRLGLSK